MKIGIISDIHGNHYALRAVMESAKKHNVEQLFVLGDIVGYYYRPDLVLELLTDFPYEIIKGNHEEILKKMYNNEISRHAVKKKYGSGHEEALKRLDYQQLKWLINLPSTKSIQKGNFTFQLNHGSPWEPDVYLYPDTDAKELERCNSEDHDFILIGHSHYSFFYRCRSSTLINCGSVGQSRQKGGVASWAIVNSKNGSYEMKATPYDTSELLQEINYLDPENDYSSQILMR